MMRRLVSILLIFLISTFSLSSSITDEQNFLITAFLREHSGQYPGGEGAPEYYYHILARNLYNAVNIEDGVAVQMGQGTSLYGDTPVPLFRIEYVTNYLDGVDITVNVSPFQLWDSQANSAVTEVTGDYPTQLKTMLKAKAGFSASHDILESLDSKVDFIPPDDRLGVAWNPPDMPEYDGSYLTISYNDAQVYDSSTNDAFEYALPDEVEAGNTEQKYSFRCMVGKVTGNWKYYLIWIFEGGVEFSSSKSNYIEDGGMITHYVEYSARIAEDEMPVAPLDTRLNYRMNVTITVENGL